MWIGPHGDQKGQRMAHGTEASPGMLPTQAVPLGHCHPSRGCGWSRKEGQKQVRVLPGDLSVSATPLPPSALLSQLTDAAGRREGELCPLISIQDHGGLESEPATVCSCLVLHGRPTMFQKEITVQLNSRDSLLVETEIKIYLMKMKIHLI